MRADQQRRHHRPFRQLEDGLGFGLDTLIVLLMDATW